MKKLIYSLLALPMLLLGSCKEELGTEPGTDSNPVVTLYAYEPTDASPFCQRYQCFLQT